MCCCCSHTKHPELVVPCKYLLYLGSALINNKTLVRYDMFLCLFLIEPFLSFSAPRPEFPWFHFDIFLMSHTVVCFLLCFKVMAATVRLPAPGGHEDPRPPFPSLRLLSHRRHAEFLRPHRLRHLWRQDHWVSTFKQLYSACSKSKASKRGHLQVNIQI